MRRVLVATPAIGHANSIPFMLVALIIAADPVFQPEDTNTAQGYVGLYLVMHSITFWGVGMNVIKKEKEDEPALAPENPEGRDPQMLGRSIGSGPSSQSVGGLNVAEVREQQWAHSVSGLELGSPVTDGPNIKNHCPSCDPGSLRRFVPKWINRPLVMAVFTAILGLLPGFEELLVPPDAPLNLVIVWKLLLPITDAKTN